MYLFFTCLSNSLSHKNRQERWAWEDRELKVKLPYRGRACLKDDHPRAEFARVPAEFPAPTGQLTTTGMQCLLLAFLGTAVMSKQYKI